MIGKTYIGYSLQLNKHREYHPSLEQQLGYIFDYHRNKYGEVADYIVGPHKIGEQIFVRLGEVYIAWIKNNF